MNPLALDSSINSFTRNVSVIHLSVYVSSAIGFVIPPYGSMWVYLVYCVFYRHCSIVRGAKRRYLSYRVILRFFAPQGNTLHQWGVKFGMVHSTVPDFTPSVQR